MSDVRFSAYSVPQWELLDSDLRLTDVSTTRALSTSKALDAKIDRKHAHLVTSEGFPLIREWGTAIVAERPGVMDVFLVDGTPPEDEQETLGITGGGVISYASGQPWLVANDNVHQALLSMHRGLSPTRLASGDEEGGIGYVSGTRSISGIRVDPLNLVRAICTMLTTHPSSDVRLTVDDTTSPQSAWIGEEERDRQFEDNEGEQVEFSYGPHEIAWYNTDDVGREIDDLAEATPFEWREVSSWKDGLPTTHLELGYPRLPAPKKDHLFFEVGSNVIGVNELSWAEYANVVLVLGQGEGSDRPRSHMSNPTTKLRRVHVESDRAISSQRRAQERARNILADYEHRQVIETITVKHTESTPFGSFDIGDVITLRGDLPWGELGQQYRITEITHDWTTDLQDLRLEEVRGG